MTMVKDIHLENLPKGSTSSQKQDIVHMRRKVCDHSFMGHPDGAASVHIIVNQLRNEHYDPVLNHKPQHGKYSECPLLPNEAYVPAIQAEWQKELYERFSSTFLCIDSTYGENAYKFRLLALYQMALDKVCVYIYIAHTLSTSSNISTALIIIYCRSTHGTAYPLPCNYRYHRHISRMYESKKSIYNNNCHDE